MDKCCTSNIKHHGASRTQVSTATAHKWCAILDQKDQCQKRPDGNTCKAPFGHRRSQCRRQSAGTGDVGVKVEKKAERRSKAAKEWFDKSI